MNIAIILSGGNGTRLGGDIPKQYIEVSGKPVIAYCLEKFLCCESIDEVQVVAEESWKEFIMRAYADIAGIRTDAGNKLKGFSSPGATRQLSVVNALEDIRRYASGEDVVVIHDAARPLVTTEMIEAVLDAIKEHDGVIPVLPMKDTVYLSEDGGHITALLERSCVCAGQAPESFKLGKYYEANMRLMPNEILKINGSTEPAILAGMDIVTVPGDEGNFKITTQADLERFVQIAEDVNGETA